MGGAVRPLWPVGPCQRTARPGRPKRPGDLAPLSGKGSGPRESRASFKEWSGSRFSPPSGSLRELVSVSILLLACLLAACLLARLLACLLASLHHYYSGPAASRLGCWLSCCPLPWLGVLHVHSPRLTPKRLFARGSYLLCCSTARQGCGQQYTTKSHAVLFFFLLLLDSHGPLAALASPLFCTTVGKFHSQLFAPPQVLGPPSWGLFRRRPGFAPVSVAARPCPPAPCHRDSHTALRPTWSTTMRCTGPSTSERARRTLSPTTPSTL